MLIVICIGIFSILCIIFEIFKASVVTAILLLTSVIITCSIWIVYTLEKMNPQSKYCGKSLEFYFIDKLKKF